MFNCDIGDSEVDFADEPFCTGSEHKENVDIQQNNLALRVGNCSRPCQKVETGGGHQESQAVEDCRDADANQTPTNAKPNFQVSAQALCRSGRAHAV